jgi:antitoxin component YwqK of YwqJK toxin-antitoxin module
MEDIPVEIDYRPITNIRDMDGLFVPDITIKHIYTNSSKIGLAMQYDSYTGILTHTRLFKDNKVQKLLKWHINGMNERTISYKNGVKHGKTFIHYKNGTMNTYDTYKNGKMNGLHRSWYGNGKPCSAYTCVDDQINGICKQWTTYNRILETMYKNGLELHHVVYPIS